MSKWARLIYSIGPLSANTRRLDLATESESQSCGAGVQGSGLMLTLSIPILNNRVNESEQEFVGVAGLDVKLSTIRGFLDAAQTGPDVYAFGVREEGSVLFHPRYEAPEPELQAIRRTACFLIPEDGVRGTSVDKVTPF